MYRGGGMDVERGIALLELLVDHYETLATLRADERLTSRDLEVELGHSRATINRHLAALREEALVSTDRGEHALTAFGAEVLQALEQFCHPLHVSAQLPALVEQLASCPVAFDVQLLAGATVTRATADAPYRMHERYLGWWNETESVYGMRSIGVIPPDVVDRLKPKLRGDVEVESIWTPPAAAQYLEAYPEIRSLWLEESNARMLITHESVPVQVGLFDARLAFTVHDDETGFPRALVDTTHPEACEWARDLHRYYRERARPLDAWLRETERVNVDRV